MRTAKIIRSTDAKSIRLAAEILSSAKEEAKLILVEAGAEAEQLGREIRQEAFAAAQTERTKLIFEAVKARDAYLSEIEPELARTVVEIVRAVFSGFNDNERVALAVENAFRALGQKQQITLHIHPCHYETLQELLRRSEVMSKAMTIEKDIELAPGACKLVSAMGVVETSLPSQIAALEQALLECVPAGVTKSDNV